MHLHPELMALAGFPHQQLLRALHFANTMVLLLGLVCAIQRAAPPGGISDGISDRNDAFWEWGWRWERAKTISAWQKQRAKSREGGFITMQGGGRASPFKVTSEQDPAPFFCHLFCAWFPAGVCQSLEPSDLCVGRGTVVVFLLNINPVSLGSWDSPSWLSVPLKQIATSL